VAHSLLLDTSSLAYRAFFALPASITDDAGQPVNAVRGYLDMTANLVRDHRPDEVVHCYDDDWRPAPRVAAYDGYKSARAPDPEGLPPQFDLLRAVLDAFGACQAEAPGWEADDAIGALVEAAEVGDRFDIVTGDRDLIQLVRDGDPAVRVLFTVKGVKELAVFDVAGVRAKYGIDPDRYVDFATLRGDPSDGLPGVKGVGEKTARDLVRRYSSLDALVADAAAQPPALARRLREAAGYLAAMRAVVPVRWDVEVKVQRPSRDDALLDELATRHKIETPVKRLREALDAA
jgi:5'-3' exonuclease